MRLEVSNYLPIVTSYLDGISLTHGHNPRKHIWTFAAALDEVGTNPSYNFPCTNIHITLRQPCTYIYWTFVTLVALMVSSISSMVTTHYGMELAMDQPTHAAL